MKKDDIVYLKHILNAMELVEEYILDKSYEDFQANHILQDAVIREIEIIGEAAKNLSPDFRDKYLEIPCKKWLE